MRTLINSPPPVKSQNTVTELEFTLKIKLPKGSNSLLIYHIYSTFTVSNFSLVYKSVLSSNELYQLASKNLKINTLRTHGNFTLLYLNLQKRAVNNCIDSGSIRFVFTQLFSRLLNSWRQRRPGCQVA